MEAGPSKRRSSDPGKRSVRVKRFGSNPTTKEVLAALTECSDEEKAFIFANYSAALAADETGVACQFLIELMHKRHIEYADYFAAKKHLIKSFSKTQWKDIKKLYGLKGIDQVAWEEPTSLYLSTTCVSDVYYHIEAVEKTVGPLLRADNEAKVTAWISAATTVIVNLFDGKVHNDVEGRLPEAASSTGGYVEFIFTLLDLGILVIMEAKKDDLSDDNAAQLMVELESAHFQNLSNGLDAGVIRGVLCSKRNWQFWSYYPATNTFTQSQYYFTSGDGAVETIKVQLKIFNRMYGLLFDSYINGLTALIKRSKTKVGHVHGLFEGVLYRYAEIQVPTGNEVDFLKAAAERARRGSEEKWTTAHASASEALVLAKASSTDEGFNAALAVLQRSFTELPREHNRAMYDYQAALLTMDLTAIFNT